MARILLFKRTTLKRLPGTIIDFFDDGKWFPPNIYNEFDVLDVPGFTRSEIKAMVRKKTPELATAYKLSGADDWKIEEPSVEDAKTADIAQIWKNSSGEWCKIEKSVQSPVTLASLSKSDREKVSDEKIDKKTREALLLGAMAEAISDIDGNTTTLAITDGIN